MARLKHFFTVISNIFLLALMLSLFAHLLMYQKLETVYEALFLSLVASRAIVIILTLSDIIISTAKNKKRENVRNNGNS